MGAVPLDWIGALLGLTAAQRASSNDADLTIPTPGNP